MKKTGLGRDSLSWINSTTKREKTKEKEIPRQISERKKHGEEKHVPKFKTFEIRLTSLLRENQLEFLEKLIRDIRKNRTPEYRKERITKNTLIRVFIDAFKDKEIDTVNIPDEEILLEGLR